MKNKVETVIPLQKAPCRIISVLQGAFVWWKMAFYDKNDILKDTKLYFSVKFT